MKLLYYITSHGYGHALRSSVICSMLPEECRVIIRTTVPREFFERELSRPFVYEPAAFDCGCVQPDGNAIDIPATLAAYEDVARTNGLILDKEASWCSEQGISVIVSDIVPFAFEVARRAGVPSVAATNFTWHTIYEDYAAAHPAFSVRLAEMRQQYAGANLLCEMYPANRMEYFRSRVSTGPVGRAGVDIADRLRLRYGISRGKRIGLIYPGNFGMADVRWERIDMFTDWEFLSLYPLPGSPRNFHRLSPREFRYQDCIASADVMITKLGYGACAECFINGLPILYLPRTGFAEYPVLKDAVDRWGHGYQLSYEEYCSLNWRSALEAVIARGKPPPYASDGARRCAQEIVRLAQGYGLGTS